MKEVTVYCRWETRHIVEVPDDYEIGGTLEDEWADQVDSGGASLVDWWV